MTFAFETVDIDRLPAQLRDASSGLAELDGLEDDAAQLIARTASPPRDTGALASSVTVRAGEISSSLVYASPVHWGWTRDSAVVAARPWVVDAANAHRDDVAELGEKHIIDSLERIN